MDDQKTVEKRISENDAKISQLCVFVDSFVSCACNSIVYERFIQKRITTVVWTRIDRCVFDGNERRQGLKLIKNEQMKKEKSNFVLLPNELNNFFQKSVNSFCFLK